MKKIVFILVIVMVLTSSSIFAFKILGFKELRYDGDLTINSTNLFVRTGNILRMLVDNNGNTNFTTNVTIGTGSRSVEIADGYINFSADSVTIDYGKNLTFDGGIAVKGLTSCSFVGSSSDGQLACGTGSFATDDNINTNFTAINALTDSKINNNLTGVLRNSSVANFTSLLSNLLAVGFDGAVSPIHLYQNDALVGTTAGITIEQDGSGDSILQFLLSGSSRWVMGADNSDSDKFKISADTDLADNVPITITTSGRLGVNQTAPSHPFDLIGAMRVLTGSGANAFFINPSGNIGIGTSTPTEKLTVIGTVNSTNLVSGTINSTGPSNISGSLIIPSLGAVNVSLGCMNFTQINSTCACTQNMCAAQSGLICSCK